MKKLDRKRLYKVEGRRIIGRTLYSLRNFEWRTIKYIRPGNAPGELKLLVAEDDETIICTHLLLFRGRRSSSSFCESSTNKNISGLLSLAKKTGADIDSPMFGDKNKSYDYFRIKNRRYNRSRTYIGFIRKLQF